MIVQTHAYGVHASQMADLYRTDGDPCGVICLLHGGFWRMPYGRDQMDPLARLLCADGFAVWNLEYRRLGDGGGWPNTFQDVAAGIDHLSKVDLPLQRVILVGHSAGGHLALWAAKRQGIPNTQPPAVQPTKIIGLAPIADLIAAQGLNLGKGAVQELMGADPVQTDAKATYQLASPYEQLPLGVPQLILHGDQDEYVPIALSEQYAQAANAAGDAATLVRLAQTGHMDFLDPTSQAVQKLRASLIE